MPTLSLGAASSLPPPLRSARFPAPSSAALPPRRLHLHSRGGRPVRASRCPEPTLRELLDEVNEMSVEKVGHLKSLGLVIPAASCLCNKAVDELINLEYSVSVIYSALSFFFAESFPRGFQKFFNASRTRHLDLATKLMECQGAYRGKAKCLPVPLPIPAEPAVKSVYRIAMAVALSLEELAYEKLLELCNSERCCEHPDIQNFIGSDVLTAQVEMINKMSEYYIPKLRTDLDEDLMEVDRALLREGDAA